MKVSVKSNAGPVVIIEKQGDIREVEMLYCNQYAQVACASFFQSYNCQITR